MPELLCPRCQNGYAPEHNYCASCGQKLPQTGETVRLNRGGAIFVESTSSYGVDNAPILPFEQQVDEWWTNQELLEQLRKMFIGRWVIIRKFEEEGEIFAVNFQAPMIDPSQSALILLSVNISKDGSKYSRTLSQAHIQLIA